MRDLFSRLNESGISLDISTFSKACKNGKDIHFQGIYLELIQKLKHQNAEASQMFFSIDSTTIILTRKLFFNQDFTPPWARGFWGNLPLFLNLLKPEPQAILKIFDVSSFGDRIVSCLTRTDVKKTHPA